MGSRYHVEIEGEGFVIAPESYRREAVAEGLDVPEGTSRGSGWKRWVRQDWRAGDGRRYAAGLDVLSGTSREPGRWRKGYGVEVGSAGRVSLGPALAPSYVSPESGFAALLAYAGSLWAAAIGSGKLYSYDGSSWGMAHDTGETALACMAEWDGGLYVGSGASEELHCFDGSAWSSLAVSGASRFGAMAEYRYWDAASSSTVSRLFLGADCSSTAKVFRYDGVAATEVANLGRGSVAAMAVYGGRLFVAVAEGSGYGGRIFAYDGRVGSGQWMEVLSLPDNSVRAFAPFDNLLFCSSARGGQVWAFDGSELVVAYDLGDVDVSDPGVDFGRMAVAGGRLFVGYDRPGVGAALLSKLPAATVGDGPVPVAGNAGGGALGNCRLGWHTPAALSSSGAVKALGAYGGALYAAISAGGVGTVYRCSGGAPQTPGSRRTDGEIEPSELDGGDPGELKVWRRVVVGHDRLGADDTVEVYFGLDGSEAWHFEGDFSELSWCDLGRSSVDVRIGEGKLLLRGYPYQGYEGKKAGDPAVPHEAWEAASADGELHPAGVVAEFTDAQYEALLSVEGSEAVTTATDLGEYAHQLYRFDLAGYRVVGLHPDFVAVGSGLGGPGVRMRLWDHRASCWVDVGGNDEVSGGYVDVEIADAAPYLSADGQLYVSLRSTNPAGLGRAAEIRCDMACLRGYYAGTGEAISARVPMPSAITRATLRALDVFVPVGAGIAYYLSADGGVHWEPATPGVEHLFAVGGQDLRWKLVLSSTANRRESPELRRLALEVPGGEWWLLGLCGDDGATSTALDLPRGLRSRRLGLRLRLLAVEGSPGPVVTGLAVEYGPRPAARRRWSFDVRCEGVPGAPLRLLDGSEESRTGGELSRQLWAARGRGAVRFRDLDGSLYEAWFDGLEETAGKLHQEKGPQTVATCTLVEC